MKRLHPDKMVPGSKATKKGKHTVPHIFACQKIKKCDENDRRTITEMRVKNKKKQAP